MENKDCLKGFSTAMQRWKLVIMAETMLSPQCMHNMWPGSVMFVKPGNLSHSWATHGAKYTPFLMGMKAAAVCFHMHDDRARLQTSSKHICRSALQLRQLCHANTYLSPLAAEFEQAHL